VNFLIAQSQLPSGCRVHFKEVSKELLDNRRFHLISNILGDNFGDKGPMTLRNEGSTASRGLSGKVAIVTGGARGIGRAIALHLARLGVAVVVADRNVAGGTTVVQAIKYDGGKAHFVAMNLERAEDVLRTVQTAASEFGQLDILVNNAAIEGALRPATDLSLAEWQQVIGTNLTGTFLLSQAAVRQMLVQGTGGSVINILAIQIYSPLPQRSAYCASKGGLLALTRAMAVELAEQGIRVNGIAVGSVYTEAVATELQDAVPEEMDRAAATLLGRMGRPAEIARIAAFLASEEASYIVGAVIPAEGGRLLSRKPDPFMTSQPASESGE
jgi:NAD(P)-dependent dehydrogenase (short-subunit alcohol dehydrogenase family)